MPYFDDEFDEYVGRIYHSKNFNVPKGVHIMNKNESALLRKLMAETGMSEEELRKEKKYRIMLSEAQKAIGSKDDNDRLVLTFVKGILKELKLPVEHYKVKDEINNHLNNPSNYYTQRFRWRLWPMDATSIIRVYLSIRKKQKGND